MKKILLLISLFVFSIGFSQNLQDFESSGAINGAPFGGMAIPVIEAGTGTNTSQVLKMVANPSQQPWQGINVNISSVNLTVNKTLFIDVLSSTPITFLVKVNTSGPEAAASVTHNGDGTWQTLSFTFDTSLDGKSDNPTGTYSNFVIHPYWEVGRTQFFTPTVVPKPARTFYVDNIRETAPVPPPVNDVTGDVYINDGSFAAGDFTTAAGQDIATNDGSAAEPFATLDYALARSTQTAGDVIYIDAGTYSWASTHALTDSGTLANPITIQGKGSATDITTTASSTTSAGLHFTTGEHWVVKDLNWTSTAARAVWVAGVDGITLDNCTINMTSTSLLQSIIINNAGGELTIKNSRLTRSNTSFHMVEVVAGTTLIMQDNTVSFSALIASGNSTSVKITPSTSSVFIIERNKFNNGGYGMHFNVGPPATLASASSIIKNNFFNTYWGLINQSITGLKVYNNSFYTFGESIYGISTGFLTGWDIQNNILHTRATNRSCILSASTSSHPAVMDYNHYYYHPNTGAGSQVGSTGPYLSFTAWQNAAGGPWEQNGQGGSAASFDPLYVDPVNGDLRLQSGSPAIDAGNDVGITDDINGDTRPLSGSFDMGADEFAAPTPISGNIYINDSSTTGDVFTSAVGQNIGTATGSASLPYQSLTDLFLDRVVAAGSTIHLDSGTYSGRITFSDTEDGTAGSIITIKGAGTGLTTLSSGGASGSLISTNGADYMTFQDMTITAGNESNAILVGGTSTNCTFNNLNITTNNNGIVVTTGSNSTTITKNKIIGDGDDGALDYGIYFTSGASNSHSVINNMVSDFAHVMRSDNTGIINCDVYHNSFYGYQFGFVGFVTGWDLRNNIFHTTSNNPGHTAFWYGDANSPATLDNNLYYHPNAAQAVTRWNSNVYATLADFVAATAFEDNGVEGNPLFVNAATGDLSLQSGSPAIGAGVDVGVTDDIDGDARPLSGTFDIGADEYMVTLSSDASLSDLQVDGVSISGFSSVVTDYTVEASSASSIPQITTATPTSSATQSVVITQATDVFEDATVVITAEDGVTTETYTIRIGLLTSEIIQDFEPTATYTDLTAANGLGSATVESNIAAPDGLSLKMVSSTAGNPWQEAFFRQTTKFFDLSVNKEIEVDVYSTQTFDMLAKVQRTNLGSAHTQNAASYTTANQWQTLTFTFDATASPGVATGTYESISLFPNSDGTNGAFVAPQNFTVYVDNIRMTSLQTDRLVYTYESGSWTPELPVGTSTILDNVLVVDGTASIDGILNANHLEISSGATLNVTSSGVLNINRDIINNGDLVFQSDLDGSGQLDTFTGSISGSGTENVERYISDKRAFRLLSSPVGGQSFADAWQQDTHITGTGGAANGFDVTLTNNPSLYTFDNSIDPQFSSTESGLGWQAVTSTSNLIVAGTPYRLFVRGDRSVPLDSNSSDATVTTLSAAGDMHTGSFSPSLATAANNFSFVGNPYQAVVDINATTRSNLTNFIYVWDASIAPNNSAGGFVTVNLSSGAPSPNSSDASQYVAPGQAFFVQNTALGNGSITFDEADKATSQSQVTVFNQNTDFYINSRLYKTSSLANNEMESDAIGLRFNQSYTTLGSDEDAGKLGNPGENYVIFNNGLKSLDFQNMPTNDHVVELALVNYEDSAYSLTFDLGHQPENLKAYLNDTYLDTQIELTAGLIYDFTVDASIAESVDPFRFNISFEIVTLSDEDFNLAELRLYPNPTEDILSIDLGTYKATNTSVKVFDLTGRILMQSSFETNESTIKIDMSQLNSGIYLVEVEEANNKHTHRVIKK